MELFRGKNNNLVSYRSPSRAHSAEVEFLAKKRGEIVPIEVKSSSLYSRSKGLHSYIKSYDPALAIKVTPNNVSRNENVLSVPIYCGSKLGGWIGEVY